MRFFAASGRTRSWAAGLLSLLLCGGVANAEIVQRTPQGFVIRDAVEVGASQDAVWSTLTNPAGWWNAAHSFSGAAVNFSLDPVPGGCFCERLPAPSGRKNAQPGGVAHMRVVYVETARVLRMTGALGPLQSEAVQGVWTITLKSVGTKTRILFEYVVGGFMRYSIDQIAPVVDKILVSQLSGLAAKVDPSVDRSSTVNKAASSSVGQAVPSTSPEMASQRPGESIALTDLRQSSTSNKSGVASALGSVPEGRKGDISQLAADVDAVMARPSAVSKQSAPAPSKAATYIYRELPVRKAGAFLLLVPNDATAEPLKLVFSSPSVEASFQKKFAELERSGTVVCQCTGVLEQRDDQLDFRAISATLIVQ